MDVAIGEWSPSMPHLMHQEEGDPSWLGSEPFKCNTPRFESYYPPWENVIHLTSLISSLAQIDVFKMRGARSCASVGIGETIGLKPNPSLLILEWGHLYYTSCALGTTLHLLTSHRSCPSMHGFDEGWGIAMCLCGCEAFMSSACLHICRVLPPRWCY